MVLQARQFFSSTVTMGDLIRNLVDSNVLFYKTAQGEARIEVIFNGDTFWMMNVWSRDVISARTTLMTCLNASEKSELPKDGIIKRLLTSMLNAVLIMMQNRIAQSCFSKWCRIWYILLSRTIRPLKSYIRGLMLRDQTVPFFLNRKVALEELCGKDEVHRMLTFESYLWCIHILFLLPVLILVLLQEDQFLFLNLRPKLLLRREKQLILARKYGLVVRRQCKTHGRVILLGAE